MAWGELCEAGLTELMTRLLVPSFSEAMDRPWFFFGAVGGSQFHLGSFLYLVGLNVSQFLSWYGWLVNWLLNYSMHYYAIIEVGPKLLCFYQHVQLWEQIIDENGFCGYFFQVFQANEFLFGQSSCNNLIGGIDG